MMSGPRFKRDDAKHAIMMSRSVTGHDFNSPDAPLPHPRWTTQTGEPDNDQASNKWKRPTAKGILSVLNPWGNNAILVISCVIAVLFDPLFFYIPYVNEKIRCLGVDNQVEVTALVLRSVTDVIYLLHIVYQLHEAVKFAASKVSGWETISIIQFAKKFSIKLSWRSFLTDVVSVFPIPQLALVRRGGVYFTLRGGWYFTLRGGSNFLLKRKILNGFLLGQYVPRIYRIYLSSPVVTESTLWIKVAFNFFLYILAGHALGAFWYFFSIHQELSCWYESCGAAHPKIAKSNCTFYCPPNTSIITDPNTSIITEKFNNTLKERCILKVPHGMIDPPFDFGIFFDALKNDIQEKRKFSEKIGYCFWWGLRNLSNFGTNLETSTHVWENWFAILVSITGLLLFLYLIGNVQIYLSKGTTRKEEIRYKIKRRKNDIINWMTKIGLDASKKKEIEKSIRHKLEEDINADLNDLFSVLPSSTQKEIKRKLCMDKLKNIPRLSNVDQKILEKMCNSLKKVNYRENTLIFQRGEPLDQIIFIVDGLVWTYSPATESSHFREATGGPLATCPSMDTNVLKNGDTLGDVLLDFASSTPRALPTSMYNVRCHTKVEAFVLMANDLSTIITEHEDLWLPVAAAGGENSA